jgi:hypothetical protein
MVAAVPAGPPLNTNRDFASRLKIGAGGRRIASALYDLGEATATASEPVQVQGRTGVLGQR